MAAELLHNRTRALGLAGAVALHALVIAALLLFGRGYAGPSASPGQPVLVAVPLTPPPPPPPPPPVDAEEGAAAPPSRGRSDAPSPPPPPQPLASPTPAEVSPDPGSGSASGAGAAPGSGAGQGGEGSGRGAGSGGEGLGSGRVTPPVRIAGALTNADYRRARPPRGAAGTVFVSYTVASDGTVSTCHVLRSSGYEVFDRATCRLIRERYRFRPARDATGRAIEWEIRDDYTWTPA